MSAFSSMDIARTGVGFSHYWMDTIAHNLANVNTVKPAGEAPFRAQFVVAQPLAEGEFSASGDGVGVREIREDANDPHRVFDPANPMADAQGYVTMPVVDMAGQMTDLMVANRSYQANLKAVQTGREAYESALRLGQRS